MQFEINNEEELLLVVNAILLNFKDERIIVLIGNLGAGKTTFTKAFAKQLGYHGIVQSPTYSLVNEYTISNQNKIYHFDLYRLNSILEAIDMGIEDYLYSKHYCFIEWFDVIQQILPENCIHVTIQVVDDKRIIKVEKL